MKFKTLSEVEAARLGAIPLDYEWDATIGNGFLAASDEDNPRLADAIEALNIHGAADLVLSAIERCLARTATHVPTVDAESRLQAAWAATVDPRYSKLFEFAADKVAPDDLWTRPERRARGFLRNVSMFLAEGDTAKVRRTALGTVLMAEHLCGRDAEFAPWLVNILRLKTASSPRRADDIDYTSVDTSLAEGEELSSPSCDERLAGLDPSANPYLRSASEMAELGFIGHPYPGHC